MLRTKGQSAFSLVELMIVVAIIGILAALAVPRFQTFQAKARAAEADTAMSAAYTLETSYNGDNDTYGDLQTIGFALNGVAASGASLTANPAKKVRFNYNAGTIAAQNFTITASAAANALGQCQTAAYTVTVDETKQVIKQNGGVPGG